MPAALTPAFQPFESVCELPPPTESVCDEPLECPLVWEELSTWDVPYMTLVPSDTAVPVDVVVPFEIE